MANIYVIPIDKPCIVVFEGMEHETAKSLIEKIRQFNYDYRYVSCGATVVIELKDDGTISQTYIGPKEELKKIREKGAAFNEQREKEAAQNRQVTESESSVTEHEKMLAFFK